jgi:sarcosine oxidase subunit beta
MIPSEPGFPVGCDVLIIGAGAYGLSAAWHLASASDARIVVVDQSDFAGNGTGRCIGGVRTQWGHLSNILMCQESIDFFEKAGDILDYPTGIDFKQSGYLLLAWDDATLDLFRSAQVAQHAHGIPSRMLTPEDVLRISPHVNPHGLRGGAICERDGTVSPFRWLDALLKDSRRRGVEVHFHTRVEGVAQQGPGFVVDTSRGRVQADKVLICTDWAAPELLKPMGISLPVDRLPVEIMVTEPWREMLGPVHISMRHSMAINQMTRGSIVINHGRPRDRGDEDISLQPDWFRRACGGAAEIAPFLRDLHVLRGWAGTISLTPDMQPIMDCPGPEGLVVGVSAYKGLMTSPAAGRYLSDLVLRRPQSDPITPFVSLARFARGELVVEPMTNGAKTSA